MNDVVGAMRDLIEAQSRYIAVMQAGGSVISENLGKVYCEEKESEKESVTFAVYSDDFLERHKSCVRRTTYDTYRWNLNKKINPEIGGMEVRKIDSAVVQDYVNDMTARGMSVHSVRDNVGIIKLVIKDYAKASNNPVPVIDVKYPRAKKQDMSERVLKSQDYDLLYRNCVENPDRVGIAVLLGMVLGMRIGEVCGLMMRDVDLKEKRVKISRSVKRVRTQSGSELEISDPKTASSVRVLPLPDEIASVIERIDLSESDYIASGRSSPTEPRTLRQAYGRLLKRLGIEAHTFHDLRHTFASRAIASGADPRSVADLMGHTTVEMTLNTYTHTDEEKRRKVVQNALCQNPTTSGLTG